MKNEDLRNYTKDKTLFEDIKHIDENGNEFWYARELMKILEYVQWRRFESVLDKAKISCENSGISSSDHFADVGKMVQIGSGAKRKQQDYKLTRYACYLIAQNGDSIIEIKKQLLLISNCFFYVLIISLHHHSIHTRFHSHPYTFLKGLRNPALFLI